MCAVARTARMTEVRSDDGLEEPGRRLRATRIDEGRPRVDAPLGGCESEQHERREDRENDQVHLGHLRDLVQFTRPTGSYLD